MGALPVSRPSSLELVTNWQSKLIRPVANCRRLAAAGNAPLSGSSSSSTTEGQDHEAGGY
jgi:hypothetical protein